MKLVCDIVQQYYEPGNYAKSYFKVWKNHVNPVYPMSYHTLIKYINTPLGALREAERKNERKQLKLFDNETD